MKSDAAARLRQRQTRGQAARQLSIEARGTALRRLYEPGARVEHLDEAEGATMNLSQDQVSVRAYQLWELEGRPHGRDQAHWFEAERQIQALAPGENGAPPPRKRPARKR